MFKIPDIWKVYCFILLGIGIGYFSAHDERNFFILGIPLIFLLRNTEFDCYTSKIKFERQKSINFALNIIKEMIDIFRNINEDNMDETTQKVKDVLKNVVKSFDVNSLFTAGIGSFISSQINS